VERNIYFILIPSVTLHGQNLVGSGFIKGFPIQKVQIGFYQLRAAKGNFAQQMPILETGKRIGIIILFQSLGQRSHIRRGQALNVLIGDGPGIHRPQAPSGRNATEYTLIVEVEIT
jgi:hypothetical protein